MWSQCLFGVSMCSGVYSYVSYEVYIAYGIKFLYNDECNMDSSD